MHIGRNEELVTASTNVRRNCNAIKRKQIDDWGYKHGVQIICLQETGINMNSVVNSENFTWFFSSGVDVNKALDVQKK